MPKDHANPEKIESVLYWLEAYAAYHERRATAYRSAINLLKADLESDADTAPRPVPEAKTVPPATHPVAPALRYRNRRRVARSGRKLAEDILANGPMGTRELLEEIGRRGATMKIDSLRSTLSRNDEFKRNSDGKWELVVK